MEAKDRKKALRKRGKNPKRAMGKTLRRGRGGRGERTSRTGGTGAGGRRRRWRALLPPEGLSLPRAVFAGVLAVSLILVGVALFRPGGILDVLRLTDRIGAMRRDMDRLAAENGRLRKEVRRLRSDPREVERIARDVLGLVRPGERVYEFAGED